MEPNNQPLNPTNDMVPNPEADHRLNPDIVSNIPLKAPNGPLTPINENDELDSLMQDVGKNLAQSDKKPAKKRFFDFKKHPKVKKPASPKPIPAVQPAHAQPPATAKPKPAKQSKAPVLTITLTIIVTGVLIAAAYYAYK